MTLISRAVIALTAVIAIPAATSAAPMYDFSSLSAGPVTALGTSEPLPGPFGVVTATAYYYDGSDWVLSTLIARNITNDNGLGVCSANEVCSEDGNYNELSQLEDDEAILLEKPAGSAWTGLWVSSLDSGGTNGAESGTLFWGYSSDITTLLGGTGFNFAYGVFGTDVEGSLALPGTFDPNATYVLFVPNGAVGDNNDYLVWGADLVSNPPGDAPVPEPASLVLLGSGLCALAHKRRRASQR